jgi:hypothetical protein
MNDENAALPSAATTAPAVDRQPAPQIPTADGPGQPVSPPALASETPPLQPDVALADGHAHPVNGTASTAPSGTPADASATTAPPAQASPSPSYLPKRPLTRPEAIICIGSIVAWVVLTAAGVAVPTKQYLDQIGATDGTVAGLALLKAWILVITCYTFTNIAMLCCLSAVVGAIGRSAQIDDVQRQDPATDLRTLCISGVIRGFFMFIVILSGTLILSDQKFDEISISQYLKLAGLVSLVSFAIGYDPHLFVSVFERVNQWMNTTVSQPGRR